LFWAWDITVTAGKEEDDPKTQTLKLSKGVITGIYVKFPAGCHRMVKTRIFHHEFQLVPLIRDEWVTGDDETVPTDPYYELAAAPHELKFVGCSPGTTYDHTVTVRITVLPPAVASMAPVIQLLTRMLNFFRGGG